MEFCKTSFNRLTPICVSMLSNDWDGLINSLGFLEKDPITREWRTIPGLTPFTIWQIRGIFQAESAAFEKQEEYPCCAHMVGVTLFWWHWETIILGLRLLELAHPDSSDNLHWIANHIWREILKPGDWVETIEMGTRGKVFYVGPNECGVTFFHEDNDDGSPCFATDHSVEYQGVRVITDPEETAHLDSVMEIEKLISLQWPEDDGKLRKRVEKLRYKAHDLETSKTECLKKLHQAAKLLGIESP